MDVTGRRAGIFKTDDVNNPEFYSREGFGLTENKLLSSS